ncbi:hypothetical protein MSAN_00901600 [Mycena sanguinolenta]|uniref:Uncharacterized protein n=1 Tax=Mycena sanguinolenta TaxID=230812 RepID=A0A8H7DBA5_9AGAR|nr:hypothetical protein MSAN_00901600 [Mycena sanguinolenta]
MFNPGPGGRAGAKKKWKWNSPGHIHEIFERVSPLVPRSISHFNQVAQFCLCPCLSLQLVCTSTSVSVFNSSSRCLWQLAVSMKDNPRQNPLLSHLPSLLPRTSPHLPSLPLNHSSLFPPSSSPLGHECQAQVESPSWKRKCGRKERGSTAMAAARARERASDTPRPEDTPNTSRRRSRAREDEAGEG